MMPPHERPAPDNREHDAPLSALDCKLPLDVELALTYVAPGLDYAGEVDCRLMFLGTRHAMLLNDFPRAATLLCDTPEASLGDAWCADPELARCHELRWEGDKPQIRLRDEIFSQPGERVGLALGLELVCSSGRLRHPCPPEQWRTLGALLPRLLGSDDPGPRLQPHEHRWAEEWLQRFERQGLLRLPGSTATDDVGQERERPGVTLIGHSSLRVTGRESAISIDPFVLPGRNQPVRNAILATRNLTAIALSHAHWDHCHLATLLRCDKSIPVFVPRIHVPTVFNPPMVDVLQSLGFDDVRELDWWETVRIGDLELVAIPFHGEEDEPGERIDHFTYVVRGPRFCLYGGVDAFRDRQGDMNVVLAEVRERHRPDWAFLPISCMTYPMRGGGVNGFCRVLDRDRAGMEFQYTAGPVEAAEWCRILAPRICVPYASFTFGSLDHAPGLRAFHGRLVGMGLSRILWPLRPGQRLLPDDPVSLRREFMRRADVALAWVDTWARAILTGARSRLRVLRARIAGITRVS